MRFIFLGILVLALWVVQAQGQELKMKIYRIPLELRSSNFYKIIQDSTGFMLLHTSNGIWSFDGRSFYPIQTHIPSHKIIALVKLGQKNLLLHSEGISQIVYKEGLNFGVENWIKCPYPTQIYEDISQNYWIALRDGRVQHYAQNQIQKIYPTITSNSHFFWQDNGQNIWLFTKEGKIYYLDKNSKKILPIELNTKLEQINEVVSKNSTSCWIASSKGVFEFSNSSTPTKPQINPIYSIPNVRNIASDNEQNYFYKSDNQRLSKLKLSNGKYQSVELFFSNKVQQIDKIPFQEIRQIFLDREQNIWLVEKNSLISLHQKFFENIHSKIPYHSIYAFAEAENGTLYLAMGEFYCVEKNANNTEGNLKQLISSENKFFASVTVEGQKVWAGTASGELYIIQKNRVLNKIVLSNRGGSIFYVYADKKKRIWFAQTFHQKELPGISYTDSSLQVRYYDSKKGLDGRVICLKANQAGEIFCSGIGNLTYLYYLDEQKDRFINLSVTLPFEADGFEVHDFDFDTKQNIWLATTHGVLKYSLNTKKIEKIDLGKYIQRIEVRSITLDKQDRVWLSTNQFGLICYDEKENSFSFGIEDGIPDSILAYRGLIINKEQYIILATLGGITKSRVSINSLKPTPKPLVARVIAYKNQPLQPIEKNSYQTSINSEVEIEFLTLSFPSNTVQYQVKILNYPYTETTSNHQNRIYLGTLPPGEYTLEIKARQVGYEWSENIHIRLKILDVWYKRWWATALWVVLSILMIWGIVLLNTWRLRLDKKRLNVLVEKKTEELQNHNQLLKIQQTELLELNEEILSQKKQIEIQKEIIEEKNKHLEDSNFTKDRLFSIIAHDLRAPLNSLISVLDLLKVNRISMDELLHLLPTLAKDVNYTAELTNNLLYWAVSQMKGEKIDMEAFDLNPIVDDNFNLFRKQAQEKGIVLVNQINESYRLWADVNMISLVLRNLLNNAIKYCKEKDKITISAIPQKEILTICVEDTGRGMKADMVSKLFDKEVASTKGTAQEKGTGLGLLLCKDFVEKNGGVIWVESEWGKGSRFYFTVLLAL